MMKSKPYPCPICGKNPNIARCTVDDLPAVKVSCTRIPDGHVVIAFGSDPDTAIRNWNTRWTDDDLK